MLLKTKLFFALGSVVVAGGTGAGVYYLKGEANSEQDIKNSGTPNLPAAGSGSVGTSQGSSAAVAAA